MLGTLGTTRADFVRLRRSVEPGSCAIHRLRGDRGDRRPLASIASDRTRVTAGRSYSPSSGPARSRVRLCRVGGRQVDAGVAGPVAYRLAERLELVGVFVPAADAGELFDDVTELLDVDGVAASPATPQVERFDLSSQGQRRGRRCG